MRGKASNRPEPADERDLIAPLFDRAFYLADYPDVRAAGIDPLWHFHMQGWREHRRPNVAFDTGWYLQSNPDVAALGIDPLVHYAQSGEHAGRRPDPRFDPAAYRRIAGLGRTAPALADFVARCAGALPPPATFDAVWYLAHYPGVAATGVDPFVHYVLYGAAEGFTPRPDAAIIGASGLFDPSYYLLGGFDVLDAGMDPLEHFCLAGALEGRRPNPYFDPAWYRQAHLAAVPQPINPLVHYILHGEAMGLRPCVYFDPAWYRRTHHLPANAAPLRHYLRNRRSQRFSPTPHFDRDFYLRTYAERIGPNRDPFAHFLVHGARGDVNPSADFDSAAYRRHHMHSPTEPPRSVEEANPLVHWLLRQDERH